MILLRPQSLDIPPGTQTRCTPVRGPLWRLGVVVAILVAAQVAACRRNAQPTPIAPEMRDAYSVTAQLFGYVWDPVAFSDPNNEKSIEGLLKRLSEDFHRVEKKAPLTMFEPGFAVTLQTNRQMLGDIRRRFESGSKDYAMWRLRSLTETCISCHSRYNVPVDFIGSPPQPSESSFEARFAAAQFLFATRQFDKASDDLFALGRSMGSLPSGGSHAVQALELWLVIQVRVKSRYAEAAEELDQIAGSIHVAPYPPNLIHSWSSSLRLLAREIDASGLARGTDSSLETAQTLLTPFIPPEFLRAPEGSPVRHAPAGKHKTHPRFAADEHRTGSRTEDSDLALLPRTLRASSILHAMLPTEQNVESRRRASYFLALAYLHLPIETFAVFRELYLEQCIREFPGTPEARDAFRLYRNLVEEAATGSGGTHLDEDQLNRLQELRGLAEGKAA